MAFNVIHPDEIKQNPFSLMRDTWFLLTAERADGTVNTMTAQWGQFGFLWGHEIATVYVRPQRYTHRFTEEATHFSLSFLPNDYREQLLLLGTVSGRDEDKIARSGLTLERRDGVPYFAESDLVVLCKKAYREPMVEARFVETAICDRVYGEKDFHTVYVGLIETVLERV